MSDPHGRALIEVRNVTKNYGTRSRPFLAVSDVSFDLKAGDSLGIVGGTGSGKSTLARVLTCLDRPTSGTVFYRGRQLADIRGDDLRQFRREVQLVFQDPFASLNRRRRVIDAVSLPLLNSGMTRVQRKARVVDVLSRVGLGEYFLNHYPHQLSGGQAQRVAIARALAPNPDVIVLDEAVSALDVSVQAQVLNLLRGLKAELGLTYLLISHDLSVVRYMCESILVMQSGRIVEQGDRETVFNSPSHNYTKTLVAAIPRLGGSFA